MNTRSIIGAAIVAISSQYACAQLAASTVEDAVHKHIDPLVGSKLIPGAVVGVFADGKESYYTLGALAYDSDEQPSFDTLYEIGSVSKVMTGILFADAIRRGEVTKDTLLDELLPEDSDAKDFEGEEIKLWHLTTHSSGWPTAPLNLSSSDPDRPFLGYTQEMVLEYISKVSPKRAPGTEFEYSNLGVGVLGDQIASNAGMGYEQAVTERVFEPIGIDDIQITLDDEELKRLAPATSNGRLTKAWADIGPFNPAGMWVGSAPAMIEFARANLSDEDGGIYDSLEAAREPMFDSGFGKVAFGWMLARDGSTYWHNGMTGGYSSYFAVNRDLETAVVVLTNGTTFETTSAGQKLFQQLVGMNPDPVKIDVREPIDQQYAQQLVGEYKSAFFTMYITSEAGKLFARITGQQALLLVEDEAADDEHTFRFELVDAQLKFDIPEEGNATTVTLLQNGQVIPCERVED
ncbi:MAG: serine hydrolase domain-containing protein [Phycisphaerales bacterium]